jgi:hypothetical protein
MANGNDDPIRDLTAYWWGREIPTDATELARQSVRALLEMGWTLVSPSFDLGPERGDI